MLALAAMTLLGSPAIPATASPPPGDALPSIVASLLSAVVNITILKQRPLPDGYMAKGEAEMESDPIKEIGSGFIIDADGYVLTARHVVEGAYKVTVVLEDRSSYPAQVLSTNARPDLALLKIEAGHRLQPMRIGDSDALRRGETVIAIGNPFGLSSSVTVGVVSALNRDINETSIDDFIQTDAAINHGNSGGPLCNLAGEVIGLNAQIISPTDTSGSIGVGLAIPINDAMAVAREMREHGRLNAGFLGLRLQQLTPEIAEVVGLHDISGGIVSGVFPGGPAALATIREGDVILQFGDLRTTDIRALLREIGITPPGSARAVRLWRNGAERVVSVTLGDWPKGSDDPAGGDAMPARGERVASTMIGLRSAALTPELRKMNHLADTVQGVIILGVVANSVGADVGFARGDVVGKVGDTAATSPEQIRELVKAAHAKGEARVLMLVTSKDRPHWLAVPTDER